MMTFCTNCVARIVYFLLVICRDLDRERTKLEAQEKKIIADIKKMAKQGQMVLQINLILAILEKFFSTREVRRMVIRICRNVSLRKP